MKTIAQIAAELQGYDPQALSADQVSAFLERLALPVTATEELGIFEPWAACSPAMWSRP